MSELPEDWTNDYIEQLQDTIADLKRQLEDQEAELGAYRQDGGERINAVLAEIPYAALAQKNKEIAELKRQLEALNEPTEAMIRAGMDALSYTFFGPDEDREACLVSRVYVFMRRAALEASDE